jgi:RHS repeat-associated protein
MRRLSSFALLVAMIAVVGSMFSAGIVEAAQPTSAPPSTPAGVIPPGPQIGPATTPTVAPRNDLVADPVPAVPNTAGLSGQDLASAMVKSGLGQIRDVRHKNPKPGDDPRDPAMVRIDTGASLLFFLDSTGNLYQQLNPGTALDPYWQSGNVIVTGPVDHPDVVRLDSGGTSTLGLFYLRTVGSLAQVMARTSTTDGASWSTETQLTSGTTAVYWLRTIVVSGTVYLFWSDTAGNLFYETSTDLLTWSTAATVGHMVGPLASYTYPSFDIAHLANGNWLLTYMEKAVTCGIIGGCNTYNYPVVYTVVGTSLASWGQAQQHLDPYNQRWPGSPSLLQASNGTVYLAYDRYEYPWGRYVRLQAGSSDGQSWSSESTFGCDPGIGCDGWHAVTAVNPYLFLDEQNHVQALWQMAAGPGGYPGAGVTDPYPDQLFQADLTTGTYYRPLPPYMDPSVNYGAGSLGSGIVNIASGNLILQESDYTLGGLGLPTTLTRTYNGGDTRDGIFGFGWSFPYATGLQVNAGGSVTIENFDGRRDYYTISGSTYTAPPGLETTLTNNGSSWTLAYRDHTSKTFDANGKLIASTDANGTTTNLAYASGRLTTITDAAGRTFTFGYDSNGRVISVSLPLSRSVGYGYDANGNLTSFTDPTGAIFRYAYGSEHMLTSVTDASGRVTTVTWTSLRRIKSVIDPAGAATTYAYGSQGASGGSTTVTDARGTVTTHTYDARGRQTRIEVTMPGGSANNLVTTFAYNADDQATSQTDPRGIVETFSYDAHGNVTGQVVDAGTGKLNLTTTSVYTNDDLTQRTDPRGTVTDFTYDSAHHLLSKTVHLDGSSQVTTYTYYSSGLLHTTTDPVGQTSGKSSVLTYDANGYLATATDAANDAVTTNYDAGGRLLKSWDARGKLTTYAYDNDDRKTSVTDPLSHSVSYTYSLDGEQNSVTDPNGIIATTVYARSGQAVLASADTGSTGFLITNPGFEYGASGWTATGSPTIVTTPILTGGGAAKVDQTDTYGRELAVTAGATYGITAYAMATAAGETARLSYAWRAADHGTISSGNIDVAVSTAGFLPVSLVPTTAPAGAAYLYITVGSTASGALVVFDDVVPTYSTLTDYDATGNKTSVMDANGHVTRYGYDAASRLVSTTDARGKTATATLDKDGNTTRATDPLATNADSVFDGANRRTSVTLDPGGLALVTSTTYDADGNTASTTDPDHHTTTYAYDRANRLVSVTDAATGVTSYGYDANGNRTSVTDARTKTTSATYDPVNRVSSATDALSHATSYVYDANGNQTRRTDANGTVTTYTFDDASRLSGASYSSGGSVTYTYDSAGRTLTMGDAHGTTTRTYDHLGRVTQVSQPGSGAVTYTYDTVGNRASVTSGGKIVSYTYTATNALASVTDWSSRTTAYAYDDAGQPSTVTYPNTIAAAYTINRAGSVTNLAYTRSGNALASFGYIFNGEGQRMSETSPDGTTGYTYDTLGRLTGTTYPDTPAETFVYDAVGNRTSRTSSGVATTYVYDDANQLATATTAGSTSTYSYDANGNRKSVVVPPTSDTSKPTVPASPAATAQAADQVTLSWTASTDNVGVTGYLIYRNDPLNSNNPFSLVGLVSGTVTSFIDRTTAPVLTYSYKVAAIDAAGNPSDQSNATLAVTTPATGPTVAAADGYGRTVSGGWGNADAGGAWTGTDSTFSVNGTQGRIALTKGATKNAYLASATGANTDLFVQVRVDQIASGTPTTDGFYLRRQDANNWYRVAAVFNTNSTISLSFVRDAAGTTTTIGTATVSGVTHSTSTYYWLRARLSGTTATTASVRLWANGTSEPSGWTLASTDSSTPANLRGSGSTGVYFDAKHALNGYYDDLTLRPIDSAAPSTPAGLTGTPVAAGRIDLSWSASTDNVGVAGYNVYRDGVKINTAPVGSISYSDTGLGAGVSHTYAISALDAAGNESSRSATWSGAAGSGAVTTAYSYDAENRLTGLQSDSTLIGTYAYDGAGNRYAKTAGGVTTAYTLDLASSLPQVLAETAGSAVTSYAYAAGPLELDKSGSTYWYLSDTLGSVRLVTDSTGATPATYAYAAFGSTRKSTGTLANEVRFSGERTDTESGLEFLRARTYDPSTGTFLQRDSWGISPTDSQSLDAYAYTANNPINAVDPSGHCVEAALAGELVGPEGAVVAGGVCVAITTAPEWVPAVLSVWSAALYVGGLIAITQAHPYPYIPPSKRAAPGPPPPGRPGQWNPNPDPGPPDETNPFVPPGKFLKGLPPSVRNFGKALLAAGGLSLIGDLLFGADPHDVPLSKPSPSPTPTPSPKSSSAPTPAPTPGAGWRSGYRME